ncbi:hypothetical protein IEQ34_003845 [Dendrobium chrysotoxum]|uniref:Uncharacterized protein n=1 Tax=Dendrobium chrysotoxum TaxID=161865 RepID=A0AAV7HFJ3_DENCH|nr:hypothetical protein IEQ34_003845 [Dendrobium chrysotoxum]
MIFLGSLLLLELDPVNSYKPVTCGPRATIRHFPGPTSTPNFVDVQSTEFLVCPVPISSATFADSVLWRGKWDVWIILISQNFTLHFFHFNCFKTSKEHIMQFIMI